MQTKRKAKSRPRVPVIRLAVDRNPKRPNTMAYTKFALIHDGMPVDQYKALEGHMPSFDHERNWPMHELSYLQRRGFVQIEAPRASGARN